MEHKGRSIQQHGARWRFRFKGELYVRGSLQEARDTLDALLDAAARREALASVEAGGGLSVQALCERWLADRDDLAPATARWYEGAIRVHIGPGLGHLDAETLSHRDLRAWYRTKPWQAARASHAVLRAAYGWGVAEDHLDRSDAPTAKARPKRRLCADFAPTDGTIEDDTVGVVSEKRIPRPHEVEKLLIDAEAHDRAWWLWLTLAVATGARPSEIAALRRRHVGASSLVVLGTKNKWSRRELPVSSGLLDTIRPHLPEDPDAYLMPAANRLGRVEPRRLQEQLERACARVGCPRYTPHAIRHYWATMRLSEGWAPSQVARYLGHADDTMVRKLYGRHIVDDVLRSIADASWRAR